MEKEKAERWMVLEGLERIILEMNTLASCGIESTLRTWPSPPLSLPIKSGFFSGSARWAAKVGEGFGSLSYGQTPWGAWTAAKKECAVGMVLLDRKHRAAEPPPHSDQTESESE